MHSPLETPCLTPLPSWERSQGQDGKSVCCEAGRAAHARVTAREVFSSISSATVLFHRHNHSLLEAVSSLAVLCGLKGPGTHHGRRCQKG